MKPREIRTYLEDLATQNRLEHAPKEYLTRDSLIYNDGGRLANTLLHICAKYNGWSKLPTGSFGEEDLLIQNASGDTSILIAAHYGTISDLPWGLLTARTMCDRVNSIGSALDNLAETDRLYLLPSCCLTPEILLEKSYTGETYLMRAIQRHRGQQVLAEIEHERLWTGNTKIAKEMVRCESGRSILATWDQKRRQRLHALKQKLESIKAPTKASPDR